MVRKPHTSDNLSESEELMKQSDAIAHFRQLCCLGINSQTAMPNSRQALHGLVGSVNSSFYWADETQADGGDAASTAVVKQKEVCLGLAEGASYRAMADRLNVRPSTVIDHGRKIYDKLDGCNHQAVRPRLLRGRQAKGCDTL